MATAPRLTDDDLAFLAEWVGTYADGDADDTDPNTTARDRVLAWAAAEQARRAEDTAARQIVAEVAARTGRKITVADAKAALRKHTTH